MERTIRRERLERRGGDGENVHFVVAAAQVPRELDGVPLQAARQVEVAVDETDSHLTSLPAAALPLVAVDASMFGWGSARGLGG
jgi:hypothetical protein